MLLDFVLTGGYVNGSSQPNGSRSGSSGAVSPNRELWGGSKGEGQYQSSLPSVAAEVLRTAYERHRRGLMSPYMYQLLTQVTYLLSIKSSLALISINSLEVERD